MRFSVKYEAVVKKRVGSSVVEQEPFKLCVVGSIPTRPTRSVRGMSRRRVSPPDPPASMIRSCLYLQTVRDAGCA